MCPPKKRTFPAIQLQSSDILSGANADLPKQTPVWGILPPLFATMGAASGRRVAGCFGRCRPEIRRKNGPAEVAADLGRHLARSTCRYAFRHQAGRRQDGSPSAGGPRPTVRTSDYGVAMQVSGEWGISRGQIPAHVADSRVLPAQFSPDRVPQWSAGGRNNRFRAHGGSCRAQIPMDEMLAGTLGDVGVVVERSDDRRRSHP